MISVNEVDVEIQSAVEVAFGSDPEKIPASAHAAYFWNSPREFAGAVQFLEIGLTAGDHCVILGDGAAHRAVCRILEERGFSADRLVQAERLTLLGLEPDGDSTLAKIGVLFQRALDRGAPLIRLLGNLGWGHGSWTPKQNFGCLSRG